MVLSHLAYARGDTGYNMNALARYMVSGGQVYSFGKLDKDGGFVFVNPKGKVTIAFRGTDNNRNWKDNLRAASVESEETGLSYHAGFYDGYQKTKTEISSILQGLGRKAPDAVVGHSRGSACASIYVSEHLEKQVKH